MTSIDTCVEDLRAIAEQLDHTASLRRRDPDHWLIERDELSRKLKRIAGRLAKEHGTGRRCAERAPEHQDLRRGGPVTAGGREVPVERRGRRFT